MVLLTFPNLPGVLLVSFRNADVWDVGKHSQQRGLITLMEHMYIVKEGTSIINQGAHSEEQTPEEGEEMSIRNDSQA